MEWFKFAWKSDKNHDTYAHVNKFDKISVFFNTIVEVYHILSTISCGVDSSSPQGMENDVSMRKSVEFRALICYD